MSEHIILVSCVGKKSARRRVARLIYESEWFLKTRTLVETTGCPWFILSAEHGLLQPTAEIDPYDRTLKKMSKAARMEWAAQVLDQIEEIRPSATKITIFAGCPYREFIVPQLRAKGIEILIPMEGLRIGEQLCWLSRQLLDYR